MRAPPVHPAAPGGHCGSPFWAPQLLVNLLDGSSRTCNGEQSVGQGPTDPTSSNPLEEVMVSRTLIRDLADRSRVVVHLQLREGGDAGGLSPVFSVTTDRYEPHGTHSGKARHRRDRDPDAGGCLHDAALLAFPELALLLDLHLADSGTGEPMHAEANGLYFYRTARGLPGGWSDDNHHAEREGLTVAGYARRVACSILRVDEIPLDDMPSKPSSPPSIDSWRTSASAGRMKRTPDVSSCRRSPPSSSCAAMT